MQLGGQPGADIVARVYFEAAADVRRDDELDAPALGRVRVSHVVAPGGGHYLKALVSGAQTGR